MTINYTPLGNRLIVKAIPLTDEEKKQGDIILAESAIFFQKAEVIKVGRGEVAIQSGAIIPMEVKEGDTVLIRKECAHIPLRIGDEDLMLMREPEIECIVQN